ncbi:hypothetical protein Bbelb_332300 [Branchiostoma belcheri]|nr:hypothetical protein Bbelb_332300 [Branchiostoma belcheri]
MFSDVKSVPNNQHCARLCIGEMAAPASEAWQRLRIFLDLQADVGAGRSKAWWKLPFDRDRSNRPFQLLLEDNTAPKSVTHSPTIRHTENPLAVPSDCPARRADSTTISGCVAPTMSGKVRQRATANPVDAATTTVNERILRECHSLYTEAEKGLVGIAENLSLKLLAPRKKITVLLIGNHSAGKSTFINWYVEEHVQRTGVAIETQGFTFVTSGKKRESLTGNATLHLYPHFKDLMKLEGVMEYLATEVSTSKQKKFSLLSSVSFQPATLSLHSTPRTGGFKGLQGVMEYLATEVSTSKQKKFSLVTFVDTPGLVDGDMKYPFDVDEAILWLGDLADLIFVFFDPMGQALCKRTLNIVEKLNEKHSERIKFYLSKADEAGSETDRQRVMMQITQELCKRPGLNKCGFDMPTIYVPQLNVRSSRCVNQIEEICKQVEKTINQTVQNTLNTLERDCEQIADIIDRRLEDDRSASSYNLRARGKGALFGFLGFILPLVLLVNFLASSVSTELLKSLLGKAGAEALQVYMAPVAGFWKSIPPAYHMHTLGALFFITLVLLFLAKWSSRLLPTLSRKQKRVLVENRDYVQDSVRGKKEALYLEYLQQSFLCATSGRYRQISFATELDLYSSLVLFILLCDAESRTLTLSYERQLDTLTPTCLYRSLGTTESQAKYMYSPSRGCGGMIVTFLYIYIYMIRDKVPHGTSRPGKEGAAGVHGRAAGAWEATGVGTEEDTTSGNTNKQRHQQQLKHNLLYTIADTDGLEKRGRGETRTQAAPTDIEEGGRRPGLAGGRGNSAVLDSGSDRDSQAESTEEARQRRNKCSWHGRFEFSLAAGLVTGAPGLAASTGTPRDTGPQNCTNQSQAESTEEARQRRNKCSWRGRLEFSLEAGLVTGAPDSAGSTGAPRGTGPQNCTNQSQAGEHRRSKATKEQVFLARTSRV